MTLVTPNPTEIMPTVNDPLAEVITGPAPVTVTTQEETGPDPTVNRLPVSPAMSKANACPAWTPSKAVGSRS